MHLSVLRHLLGEDGDDTTFCPQNVSKRLDVTFCPYYVPEHSELSVSPESVPLVSFPASPRYTFGRSKAVSFRDEWSVAEVGCGTELVATVAEAEMLQQQQQQQHSFSRDITLLALLGSPTHSRPCTPSSELGA